MATWIWAGIAAGVGFGAGQLPIPYSNVALGLLFVAVLALFAVGNKAAYRAHPLGLLAQYTEPRKLLSEKLSAGERLAALLSVAVVLGVAASFFVGKVGR